MRYDKVVEDAVRASFVYDPVTGDVSWASRGASRRVSKKAGYLRKDGYIDIDLMAGEQRVRVKAHIVAWFLYHGYWPVGVLDHINRTRNDNRIVNLRDVDHQTNMHNISLHTSKNKTGLVGAVEMPDGKGFRSLISVDGVEIHLGVYCTAREAHAAYIGAKKVLHRGYVPVG